MVKGICRQVVVVRSPDKKLFEQAIFILREDAAEVTDELLLKEAKQAVRSHNPTKRKLWLYGPAWACAGAVVTGLIWMVTSVF